MGDIEHHLSVPTISSLSDCTTQNAAPKMVGTLDPNIFFHTSLSSTGQWPVALTVIISWNWKAGRGGKSVAGHRHEIKRKAKQIIISIKSQDQLLLVFYLFNKLNCPKFWIIASYLKKCKFFSCVALWKEV